MPGIYAYVSKDFTPNKRNLNKLRKSILKYDNYVKLETDYGGFIGTEYIASERICISIDKTKMLFLDGEVFPILNSSLNTKNGPLSADELINMWENSSKSMLKEIKGWFSIIIIDFRQKSIYLISDRFGYKSLYYARLSNGDYVISSEARLIENLLRYERPTKINFGAVAELSFYNYVLSDTSFFNNISSTQAGTITVMSGEEVNINNYWDIPDEWFCTNKATPKHAADIMSDTLSRLSKQMIPENNSVGLTLTGGFDCRTVLSMLRDYENIELFTLGLPNSFQGGIASNVARKLGKKHNFISLDSKFTNNIYDYALKTLLLSEGFVGVERAHYTYVFGNQSKRNKVICQGDGGSDLIRGLSQEPGGAELPFTTSKLLLGYLLEDVEDEINSPENNFFHPDLRKFFKKYIMKKNHSFISKDQNSLNKKKNIYKFLLYKIFPKYFGKEVALENCFTCTRPIFLDYDFIESNALAGRGILHTPLFFVSRVERLKNQQVYAYMIKKHDTRLLHIGTDRGYTPYDLISRYGFLNIISGQYKIKHLIKKSKLVADYDVLSTILPLAKAIFSEITTKGRGLYDLERIDKYLKDVTTDKIKSMPKRHWINLAHVISLELWLRGVYDSI